MDHFSLRTNFRRNSFLSFLIICNRSMKGKEAWKANEMRSLSRGQSQGSERSKASEYQVPELSSWAVDPTRPRRNRQVGTVRQRRRIIWFNGISPGGRFWKCPRFNVTFWIPITLNVVNFVPQRGRRRMKLRMWIEGNLKRCHLIRPRYIKRLWLLFSHLGYA